MLGAGLIDIEKLPLLSVVVLPSEEPSEPLELTETALIAAAFIPFCIAVPETLNGGVAVAVGVGVRVAVAVAEAVGVAVAVGVGPATPCPSSSTFCGLFIAESVNVSPAFSFILPIESG